MVTAPPRAMAPPPPPVISETFGDQSIAGPPVTFDVEAKSSTEVLWAGEMRVSQRQGASVSRQQSNASASPCSATPQRYDAGERSSLSINLNQMRRGQDDYVFQLRVNWERPGDGAGCQRSNSRSVGISENITIEPGHEQIVRGDGGLIIRIRRR